MSLVTVLSVASVAFIVSKTTCFEITKDRVLKRYDFLNSAIFVLQKGKRLSVSPAAVTHVRHPSSCSWKCIENRKCWSFNLAVREIQGRFQCELLSTDKYSTTAMNFQDNEEYNHYQIESQCEHAPCVNGGTCQHDYETGAYICQCPAGFNGKNCEWKKVNTNQVCFSAKGNQYGAFTVPKRGEIKAFKLIYLSGRVAAYGAGSNWGTTGTRLDTIITNTVNQVLSPPQSILHATYYHYSLPEVSASDPELILPEMKPPLAVTAGQAFRVWFGEDLKDATESDNSGTTCADVYVNYRQ